MSSDLKPVPGSERYFRYVNWQEAEEIIKREKIETWNAGELRFVEIKKTNNNTN